MAVALIVGAGRGERLGAGVPKALVEIDGRTLLELSVAVARAAPEVSSIVVALPRERLDAAPEGVICVAGGQTRSQSVAAALAAAPADDVVLVHDAARALAGPELFGAVIDRLAVGDVDAVVPAAAVHDTIKQVNSGLIVERTLDRSSLWAVQTPQAFRRAALESALAQPGSVLASASDDASLIELEGGEVAILPNGPENFKITTPLDLQLAQVIFSQRGKRAGAAVGGVDQRDAVEREAAERGAR